MSGDCATVGLTESLVMIKASGNESNGVDAIKFKESENKYKIGKLYGDVGQEKILWNFTENIMPVGVWGETTDRGIEKLGFVTVNRECQAAILDEEQIVDVDNDTFEQAEGNAEGSEVDGEITDTIAPELTDTNLTDLEGAEEANESSGMGAYTWVIIVAGSVIFIAILIITIFALKRGIKAKSD